MLKDEAVSIGGCEGASEIGACSEMLTLGTVGIFCTPAFVKPSPETCSLVVGALTSPGSNLAPEGSISVAGRSNELEISADEETGTGGVIACIFGLEFTRTLPGPLPSTMLGVIPRTNSIVGLICIGGCGERLEAVTGKETGTEVGSTCAFTVAFIRKLPEGSFSDAWGIAISAVLAVGVDWIGACAEEMEIGASSGLLTLTVAEILCAPASVKPIAETCSLVAGALTSPCSNRSEEGSIGAEE